jgi:signal transduction histidine kinase
VLRVLHLEDNLLDAELILANLLEGGLECVVRRVDTRADFEAAIAAKDFEIILADYSLPSFDGLAALEIARAETPDTPFIIISGALGEELAIETLKSGATDYILKHRLERLVPSVRRALREAAEREARKHAEQERELSLKREKEARLKAEEASRLKDEFLATVSHELRTPLNAIYGWATMLRSGKLNAANAANAIEIIERNARIQIQLIEDLLDVSRMMTGNLRLTIEAVEPVSVIRAAIDVVRPAAEVKNIEIVTDFDSRVKMIFADAARLQQIIWNLLSNAVKFTPNGGRVTVRLRLMPDSNIEISVTDTGEGIAPDFLPHIFERFRQAEQATTRVHGGLGLGLAIVKNLAEMHGGSVTAESEGLGRGATLSIILPQPTFADDANECASDGVASQTTAASEKPLAGLRIVAVDDEPDSLNLLQIVLQQHGARVFTADCAAQASKIIEEESPDVLISDIRMPVENGYNLIERVRLLENQKSKPIAAVALTSFTRAEDEQRARRAGFDAHLSKPLEPQILIQTILSVAGQ